MVPTRSDDENLSLHLAGTVSDIVGAVIREMSETRAAFAAIRHDQDTRLDDVEARLKTAESVVANLKKAREEKIATLNRKTKILVGTIGALGAAVSDVVARFGDFVWGWFNAGLP